LLQSYSLKCWIGRPFLDRPNMIREPGNHRGRALLVLLRGYLQPPWRLAWRTPRGRMKDEG
ncbi:MAG: hypothetical protein ACRELG_25965, partial [Gemmataceae bacterium]